MSSENNNVVFFEDKSEAEKKRHFELMDQSNYSRDVPKGASLFQNWDIERINLRDTKSDNRFKQIMKLELERLNNLTLDDYETMLNANLGMILGEHMFLSEVEYIIEDDFLDRICHDYKHITKSWRIQVRAARLLTNWLLERIWGYHDSVIKGPLGHLRTLENSTRPIKDFNIPFRTFRRDMLEGVEVFLTQEEMH